MNTVFVELSLILAIATLVAGIVHLLRQPLIIGHIITGLLVGPYVFNLVHSGETFEVFSQLGIALLLFIIGLGLNPRVIKEVGAISLVTGIGQVLFTVAFGLILSRLMGFSLLSGLYIAIALAFSSTIIILKLLSDKKELGRLYAKISIGFLLVQDILATIILLLVTALSQEKSIEILLVETFVKGTALAAVLIGVSMFILPRITSFFARSPEFLFLFSIGWGLGMASLFQALGFSIEIGALFSGVALAASPFSNQISARMRPLRDFFIVLFFILLGSRMVVEDVSTMIVPTLVFSTLILVGNPLIVMILMGILGYRKKTSFKAGLAVAQISEFSLILIILGNRIGHISQEAVSLVTMVALITIAVSTYFIVYADALYKLLEPVLSIFERKHPKPEYHKEDAYDAILIGYDGVGHEFVRTFQKEGVRFLVVDYDPEVIEKLSHEKYASLYGDANDNEFLEELPLDKAKMLISSVRDLNANLLVLEHIKHVNKDTIVMVTAEEPAQAHELYEKGASYVMMPDYLGGLKTSALVSKSGFNLDAFTKEKEKHLAYLAERMATPRTAVN